MTLACPEIQYGAVWLCRNIVSSGSDCGAGSCAVGCGDGTGFCGPASSSAPVLLAGCGALGRSSCAKTHVTVVLPMSGRPHAIARMKAANLPRCIGMIRELRSLQSTGKPLQFGEQPESAYLGYSGNRPAVPS